MQIDWWNQVIYPLAQQFWWLFVSVILLALLGEIARKYSALWFVKKAIKAWSKNKGENASHNARRYRKEPAVKIEKDTVDRVFDTLQCSEKSQEGKSKKSLSERLMEEGEAYIARSHLMSPTERRVYKALERDYGESFYIFCQVRVVDIIQPNIKKYHSWTKEYQALFRQVSQWHFDYVFCSREKFKIVCTVELDDETHEQESRRKRDKILNEACKIAGLSLKRIKLDEYDRLTVIS